MTTTVLTLNERRIRRLRILAVLRRRRILARHLHRTRLWRML